MLTKAPMIFAMLTSTLKFTRATVTAKQQGNEMLLRGWIGDERGQNTLRWEIDDVLNKIILYNIAGFINNLAGGS